MKPLPNMNICEKGHMYPRRFDKCPHCHEDAVSAPLVLTPEQIEIAAAHSIRRGDLDESQRREEK